MIAIANVIYGKIVDDALLRRICDEVRREDLPDDFLAWLFPKEKGNLASIDMKDVHDALIEGDGVFEFRYSGSADQPPRFLGVAIGNFSEAEHRKITAVQLSPTAEQYATARERLEKFPEILRKYFEPFEIWIMWSTS